MLKCRVNELELRGGTECGLGARRVRSIEGENVTLPVFCSRADGPSHHCWSCARARDGQCRVIERGQQMPVRANRRQNWSGSPPLFLVFELWLHRRQATRTREGFTDGCGRTASGELVPESARCTKKEDRGWRTEPNEERPPSSLGYRTRKDFCRRALSFYRMNWRTRLTRWPACPRSLLKPEDWRKKLVVFLREPKQ